MQVLLFLFQCKDRNPNGLLQYLYERVGDWYLSLGMSLKSVSSMKLRRDSGISQPRAQFRMLSIRKALVEKDDDPFNGAVNLIEVVGAKCREPNEFDTKVATDTWKKTLKGIFDDVSNPDTVVYTNDAKAY